MTFSTEHEGNHALLTKPELAERMRKTPRTIETWMRQGLIPYLKIGRTIRFDWQDVLAHIKENHGVTRRSA